MRELVLLAGLTTALYTFCAAKPVAEGPSVRVYVDEQGNPFALIRTAEGERRKPIWTENVAATTSDKVWVSNNSFNN